MATRVRPSLVLEGGEARADGDRLRMLQAIDEAGSITAAGRRLGLTYRAAWNSVQSLNALFGVRLIEASMGGPGGGRTPAAES